MSFALFVQEADRSTGASRLSQGPYSTTQTASGGPFRASRWRWGASMLDNHRASLFSHRTVKWKVSYWNQLHSPPSASYLPWGVKWMFLRWAVFVYICLAEHLKDNFMSSCFLANLKAWGRRQHHRKTCECLICFQSFLTIAVAHTHTQTHTHWMSANVSLTPFAQQLTYSSPSTEYCIL